MVTYHRRGITCGEKKRGNCEGYDGWYEVKGVDALLIGKKMWREK